MALLEFYCYYGILYRRIVLGSSTLHPNNLAPQTLLQDLKEPLLVCNWHLLLNLQQKTSKWMKIFLQEHQIYRIFYFETQLLGCILIQSNPKASHLSTFWRLPGTHMSSGKESTTNDFEFWPLSTYLFLYLVD